MKKKLIGGGVAVIIILLAVAGYMMAKKNTATQNTAAPVQTQQAATPGASTSPADKIVSSIKDAMGAGTQMKCTYTSKGGDSSLESTVYIEGTKYLSAMTIGNNSMLTFFDGDTIYSWTDGKTTGTKIAMSCMADLKSSLPQDQQDAANSAVKNPSDGFDSALNTKCTPSSEADFTIPTNITFTDQCEMMKKSIEMMKNVKLPANMPKLPANIPGVPSGSQQ